jgi:hypothetical protein
MDLENLEKQLDEAIESGPKTLIWFAEELIVEILRGPERFTIEELEAEIIRRKGA